MQIEFSIIENTPLYTTLCPFSEETPNKRTRVGSFHCMQKCSFFVSIDYEKKVVVCNSPKQNKNENKDITHGNL